MTDIFGWGGAVLKHLQKQNKGNEKKRVGIG